MALSHIRTAISRRVRAVYGRSLVDHEAAWLGSDEPRYYVKRGRQLRILRVPRGLNVEWIGGENPRRIAIDILAGKIDAIQVARLADDFSLGPWTACTTKRGRAAVAIRKSASISRRVNSAVAAKAGDAVQFFDEAMRALQRSPDLIDFVAAAVIRRVPANGVVPLPFDELDALPPFKAPAEPARKSVLFLHNSYYHFNTLAAALKKRGWDAVTVSVEAPTSPQRQFYIGEDINLYHDDVAIRHRQIRDFFRAVPERFGVLHFYGYPNFFAENAERQSFRTRIPFDMLELRRHGIVVGYSPSGCLDGVRQSTIRTVADGVCGRCVWELRPDVCSDARNAAWAETINDVCDWVCAEGDFAADARTGSKFVRDVVTSALDPDFWASDLEISESKRVERGKDEILVYHAFGFASQRQRDGRDIKGSGAVQEAIARLQAEGIPVRLYFAKDLPISEVRYYKAQADIVVDQLNYGRIGANARESFMMGKPLITRLNPRQHAPLPLLGSVVEAPALNASEETILPVLRNLILDRSLRESLSSKARTHALRWYAADVCARRFEMVIDRVRRGLPPETPELYPNPVFNPFAEPNFGQTAQAS